MKLNKDRFINSLYCWGIKKRYDFDREIIFYTWKSISKNIGNTGFLSQMYDRFSFSDFFEAREIVKKYNKKHDEQYRIWYEKKEF